MKLQTALDHGPCPLGADQAAAEGAVDRAGVAEGLGRATRRGGQLPLEVDHPLKTGVPHLDQHVDVAGPRVFSLRGRAEEHGELANPKSLTNCFDCGRLLLADAAEVTPLKPIRTVGHFGRRKP